MPNESAHLRAHDGWKALQKTHKRPPNLEISFQSRSAYSLRFILAGDLTSAWKTFGGLSAQLTHLGAVLNIATLENATIAMAHDSKIWTYANELSKFRERDNDIITLLTSEYQRIKRENLRDCGCAQTFARAPTTERKGQANKQEQKGTKRDKGKQVKGKGNGAKSRKNDKWKPQNNNWNNSWTYGKRNDWPQPSNEWPEGTSADKVKPSEEKTTSDDQKAGKKKKRHSMVRKNLLYIRLF